jgi:hypothetical protein
MTLWMQGANDAGASSIRSYRFVQELAAFGGIVFQHLYGLSHHARRRFSLDLVFRLLKFPRKNRAASLQVALDTLSTPRGRRGQLLILDRFLAARGRVTAAGNAERGMWIAER